MLPTLPPLPDGPPSPGPLINKANGICIANLTSNNFWRMQVKTMLSHPFTDKHTNKPLLWAVGSRLALPSVPLQFHHDIHNADMVIDQTDLAKDLSDADATYNDWLSAGNFEPGTVSFDQPFIHHNALYRVDGLTDEKGFLDWSQRAAARPDLALTGRVMKTNVENAVEPTSLSPFDLRYYSLQLPTIWSILPVCMVAELC